MNVEKISFFLKELETIGPGLNRKFLNKNLVLLVNIAKAGLLNVGLNCQTGNYHEACKQCKLAKALTALVEE